MIPYKHIHFIGIGGIGMSALARMCLAQNISISGSDSTDSDILKKLKAEGATIYLSHKKEHITDDIDCVVYTVAIDNFNEELEEARLQKLPLFTYAQMLGEVSKSMYTIAVAGTHGKTTTTAMTADVFLNNDKKPHVIVGSLLAQTGSNYVFGYESTFIVEACEYKRSFLNITPDILLITNIEADHLDYYKDLRDIQNAFRDLVQKVPQDGFIICDTDDEKIKPVLKNAHAQIIDYKKYISHVPELYVLGEHNILNASLVLALSDVLHFNQDISQDALKNFKGTWRRLEFKKDFGSLKIYDDYAHHPTEIEAQINAFRKKYPTLPLTIVFQPHLYSRTKEHFKQFIEILSCADTVVVLPIYAAREVQDDSITSNMLVEELLKKKCNAILCTTFQCAVDFIQTIKNTPGVVVTTGAGDVFKIINLLNE